MASRIVTLRSFFTRLFSNSGLHSACMKSTILALLFVLVGCGGNIKPQSSLHTSTVPRSGIVFVGDSIFGRWDLGSYFPGKGYVNGGWFGRRTDQILSVFPAILDGSNVCHGYMPDAPNPPDPAFPFSCSAINPPAEVVILLGWNDLFQGKDPEQAAGNINMMAKMAGDAGVKVVLVIPYRFDSAHPASWMQPWDACSDLYPYRDTEPVLNANIGGMPPVPLVNLESIFVCQSDYTIDGVHPNASGYQQMHDAIAKVI